jgi:hypothetical protein
VRGTTANLDMAVFSDEDDARLTMIARWHRDAGIQFTDSDCRNWLRRMKTKGNVYFTYLDFLKEHP